MNASTSTPAQRFRLFLPSWSRVAALYDACYFECIGVVERVFTVPLIALCLPIFAVIGLLVRFGSRQKVFYGQQRYGADGVLFTVYKFTTMPPEVPEVPSDELAAYEHKITPIGRFLRSTRLNELPQLYNVLKGDMRWVGPRPTPPFHTELQMHRRVLGLHLLKPGLTFIDRISGGDDLTMEQRIEFEQSYMEGRGGRLRTDIKILLRTVLLVISRPCSRSYMG